jgi:peptide/nickel transport system permease protein
MTVFLLHRMALVLPTLFFVSVLIFGLQQLLPGDPALALAGENQEPAVFTSLHQKYHLDQLLPVRCALWVEAYCRAISASDPDQAAGFGSLLRKIAGDRRAGIIGARRRLGYRCASGVIAAVNNDTTIDYRAMVALWGLSIPNCWLGILLILLFSVELGLLPASDFVSQVPVFVRLTRGQVLLVKHEEYVEAAHAIGNSARRIVLRHILPNIIPPLLVQATLATGRRYRH